jgi:hypothetical protein
MGEEQLFMDFSFLPPPSLPHFHPTKNVGQEGGKWGRSNKENKAGDLFLRNEGGTNISQSSGNMLIHLRSTFYPLYAGARRGSTKSRLLNHQRHNFA